MIRWAFKPIYIHFSVRNENTFGAKHMMLNFTDIFILLLKHSTLTNVKKNLRFKYQVKIRDYLVWRHLQHRCKSWWHNWIPWWMRLCCGTNTLLEVQFPHQYPKTRGWYNLFWWCQHPWVTPGAGVWSQHQKTAGIVPSLLPCGFSQQCDSALLRYHPHSCQLHHYPKKNKKILQTI